MLFVDETCSLDTNLYRANVNGFRLASKVSCRDLRYAPIAAAVNVTAVKRIHTRLFGVGDAAVE